MYSRSPLNDEFSYNFELLTASYLAIAMNANVTSYCKE